MGNKKVKTAIIELGVAICVIAWLSFQAAPRLSQAARESKLAELSDTLYLIRCTIDMYRSENDGLLPGQKEPDELVMPGDFVRALTTPGPDDRQPYFQRFPNNPFNVGPDSQNTITCVNDKRARPDGTEGTAWWFNSATGQFRACDSKFHAAY